MGIVRDAPIGCTVAEVPAGDVPAAASELQLLGANPTSWPLHYTIHNRGDAAFVRIRLVDIAGRNVSVVWEGVCREGTQPLSWTPPDARRLRTGIYYLELSREGRLVENRKVLIFG